MAINDSLFFVAQRIFKELKITLYLILYITTMNYKNQNELPSILFPLFVSFYKSS
jgi:hypothetical protein